MNLTLRTEIPADYPAVAELVEEAFRAGELPYADEALLVERLRKCDAFIPELSIVAELDGQIIGHILLTKTMIRDPEKDFSSESLALAPVCVKPAFQRRGIGEQLIIEAHKRAKGMGFRSINLVGHEHYYPRFGYERASKYNVRFPFEAPDENCMILSLAPGALEGITGTIEFPPPFFQQDPVP